MRSLPLQIHKRISQISLNTLNRVHTTLSIKIRQRKRRITTSLVVITVNNLDVISLQRRQLRQRRRRRTTQHHNRIGLIRNRLLQIRLPTRRTSRRLQRNHLRPKLLSLSIVIPLLPLRITSINLRRNRERHNRLTLQRLTAIHSRTRRIPLRRRLSLHNITLQSHQRRLRNSRRSMTRILMRRGARDANHARRNSSNRNRHQGHTPTREPIKHQTHRDTSLLRLHTRSCSRLHGTTSSQHLSRRTWASG